jgi:MSHA biogenesis protein MshO
MRRARGFTLLELVVAITISAVVILFVAMFVAAPVDAYEAHARRNVLVADAATAWPRIEADLRESLPNSVRERRNGAFVALEFLRVEGWARYQPPLDASFTTAGALPLRTNSPHQLSVNNLAVATAYAAGPTVTVSGVLNITAIPMANETSVSVSPVPTLAGGSPGRRIYLVSGPVTYLCDEGQGTLRRYSGYTPAASQTARDTAAELTAAGAGDELVARGLSTCHFAVSTPSSTQAQAVAARLTTTYGAESVTLLHTVRSEHVP